jgi:hypothetical protein
MTVPEKTGFPEGRQAFGRPDKILHMLLFFLGEYVLEGGVMGR